MSSKFQDGAAPITAAALPRTATLWSCVVSRFINVFIQNCINVSNPALLTLYAMFLFRWLIMKCYDFVSDYYIFTGLDMPRKRHYL